MIIKLKRQLKKVIRYSDPTADKKTLFVWPEGIFAGVYYEDLNKFSNYFKKKFFKKSFNSFWY